MRLGDVVRSVNKTSRDPEADGLTRIVGLEHIEPGSLTLQNWDDLATLHEGTSFSRVFRSGQVLFGKRRAYQRKVAVAHFDGICSGDLLVLEASDDRLLPELLPYVVLTDDFFAHALGTSAGSLSPRTKWSELARYEMALPPIQEQRRLVEVARAFQANIREHRRVDDAAGQVHAALRANFFALAAEAGAARCDLLADVQVGKKLSPAKRLGTRPRPYIRALNLKLDGIVLVDVKEMDFLPREDDILSIRAGDVLLVEGGNRDSVGAPTLVEVAPDPRLYIQNTIVRLRLRRDAPVSAQYLYWAWRAMFESGRFEKVAVGTKLYHLGPRRVAEVLVPILPPEQARVWLDQVTSVATLRTSARAAVLRLGDLERATMQHLLNGAA